MSSNHPAVTDRGDGREATTGAGPGESAAGRGLFASEGQMADLTVLLLVFALVATTSAVVAATLV